MPASVLRYSSSEVSTETSMPGRNSASGSMRFDRWISPIGRSGNDSVAKIFRCSGIATMCG